MISSSHIINISGEAEIFNVLHVDTEFRVVTHALSFELVENVVFIIWSLTVGNGSKDLGGVSLINEGVILNHTLWDWLKVLLKTVVDLIIIDRALRHVH